MNEWKVAIEALPSSFRRGFYIYRDIGVDDVVVLYYDPEKETFEEKKFKAVEQIKPTFMFPHRMGVESKLLEALAGIGIKPESESVNEGKLEAMGKHLEDMRRLVFRGIK